MSLHLMTSNDENKYIQFCRRTFCNDLEGIVKPQSPILTQPDHDKNS